MIALAVSSFLVIGYGLANANRNAILTGSFVETSSLKQADRVEIPSEAVWRDISPGSGREPTIIIEDADYPDRAGVRFFINGRVDERNSNARPDGFDATGPREDSQYHVYPGITLNRGDVVTARWTDRNGTPRRSTATIGSTTAGGNSSGGNSSSPTVNRTLTPGSGSGPSSDDGLNPVYDGNEGIYPVSPRPIPSGFPTPATTGVPDGVQLRPSGGLEITQDGTVIDGLDIDGRVVIEANNVVIRNSRITSNAHLVVELEQGYSGLLIEDTRIRGVGSCSAGIAYSNYTARRVHITGCSDGAKMFSNTLFEDSYISNRYRVNGVSHNDGIQSSGGFGITIRGNTILGSYQMSTSAIKVTAGQSNMGNVLIENNYLSGGAYTLYTTIKDGRSASDVTVRNNVFDQDGWLYGWRSNKISSAVYTGNTFYTG